MKLRLEELKRSAKVTLLVSADAGIKPRQVGSVISFTGTYNGRGSFVERGFQTQLLLGEGWRKEGGGGARQKPRHTLSAEAILETPPLIHRSKGAKLDFLARRSFRVMSPKPYHSFPKRDISKKP